MNIIALTLFLLVSFLPIPQQPATFTEFTSVEGRFSAAMPGEPKSSQTAIETREGILVTNIVSVTNLGVNEYLVSWTEYPRESIEARATEKTFNKMRDALVKFKGGKVLSETALISDPCPTKTVTFTTSDDKLARVTFYFAKNRIYQVMAETKGPGTEALEPFFRSFKLLPGTPL